jgi:periplasmic divalent cation tolerance protein
VILSTCPDADMAARIGQTLAESALVACVNIAPGLRSIYRRNDAVQDEEQDEEVVALPVVDGHDAYLRWVSTSTRTPKP